MIENQLNRKIKKVQTDNGCEFSALRPFLDESCIMHRKSCPYVHQQMDAVECWHRHIVYSGITLLDQAKLPWSFWSHAFSTAKFLYNRTKSKILASSTPFQALFEKVPNLWNIRVFGSLAYPNLRPSQKSKFSARSAPHAFIGYPKEKHKYTLIDPFTKKMIIANDVVFLENNFNFNKNLHSNESQESSVSSLPISILHATAASAPPDDSSTMTTNPNESLSTMPSSSPTPMIESTAIEHPLLLENELGTTFLEDPPELPTIPKGHHMRT